MCHYFVHSRLTCDRWMRNGHDTRRREARQRHNVQWRPHHQLHLLANQVCLSNTPHALIGWTSGREGTAFLMIMLHVLFIFTWGPPLPLPRQVITSLIPPVTSLDLTVLRCVIFTCSRRGVWYVEKPREDSFRLTSLRDFVILSKVINIGLFLRVVLLAT